jgi:hypothetical protein
MWLAFWITASESADAADPPDKLSSEHIASRDCDERMVLDIFDFQDLIPIEDQSIKRAVPKISLTEENLLP